MCISHGACLFLLLALVNCTVHMHTCRIFNEWKLPEGRHCWKRRFLGGFCTGNSKTRKEIFSVHGNLVLKMDAYGTDVKFKVCALQYTTTLLPLLHRHRHHQLRIIICSWQGIRDANLLMELLCMIFSKDLLQKEAIDVASCSGAAPTSNVEAPSYDNMFTVHMAIVTANLGKKLFVSQKCLLYCIIQILFPRGRHSSAAAIEFSDDLLLDEKCNAQIFSILDWAAVYGKCVEANILKGAPTQEALEQLASWNNTITVTAKGAVILRFSW